MSIIYQGNFPGLFSNLCCNNQNTLKLKCFLKQHSHNTFVNKAVHLVSGHILVLYYCFKPYQHCDSLHVIIFYVIQTTMHKIKKKTLTVYLHYQYNKLITNNFPIYMATSHAMAVLPALSPVSLYLLLQLM